MLNRQEGAEIEEDNGNNDDIPDPLMGEGEEKTEQQEPVERPRKTSKFMTKYERARILGTRALQIRSFCFFLNSAFDKALLYSLITRKRCNRYVL